MQAVRCTSLGDEPPSPLDIADIPVPAPGPDQVLIRVQACGLNVADELMRQGRYQLKLSPPFTPGQEVAGIIESVGPAVPDLSAGDPVVAIVDGGGLAQYALGDATSVLPRPPGLDAASAAAVAVSYGTTDIALGPRAHLERGENLVIFGAGGMIGQCAVALGRRRGANVIAVASTQERADRAVTAGASYGFASDRADLRELIYEATAGHGADVVLDSVGGPAFATALRIAAFNARILSVGFASGTVASAPLNILLVKNLNVSGVFWGGHLRAEPGVVRASLAHLLDLIAAGALPVPPIASFPLSAAEQAFAYMNQSSGQKVVVSPTFPPGTSNSGS
jgi:NADPH2:quinone reductase